MRRQVIFVLLALGPSAGAVAQSMPQSSVASILTPRNQNAVVGGLSVQPDGRIAKLGTALPTGGDAASFAASAPGSAASAEMASNDSNKINARIGGRWGTRTSSRIGQRVSPGVLPAEIDPTTVLRDPWASLDARYRALETGQ